MNSVIWGKIIFNSFSVDSNIAAHSYGCDYSILSLPNRLHAADMKLLGLACGLLSGNVYPSTITTT